MKTRDDISGDAQFNSFDEIVVFLIYCVMFFVRSRSDMPYDFLIINVFFILVMYFDNVFFILFFHNVFFILIDIPIVSKCPHRILL